MERNKKRIFILVGILAILSTYLIFQLLLPDEPQNQRTTQTLPKPTPKVEAKKPEAFEIRLRVPTYDLQSLRDPFYPQIVRRDTSKGSSALESFDLEELRLIGVLRDEKTARALLKTPDGRFFVVKERDRVGLGGAVVTKILSDRVEIIERPQRSEGVSVKKTLKLRPEE